MGDLFFDRVLLWLLLGMWLFLDIFSLGCESDLHWFEKACTRVYPIGYGLGFGYKTLE